MIGTPPKNIVAIVTPARMMPEPRSPWATTSRRAAPNTMSTGRSVARVSCRRSARRVSRSATYTMRASFMTSEGWNVNAPMSSHARAPLTWCPRWGTSVATIIPNVNNIPSGMSLRQLWYGTRKVMARAPTPRKAQINWRRK